LGKEFGGRSLGVGNWVGIKVEAGEALAPRRPGQVKDPWRTLEKLGWRA